MARFSPELIASARHDYETTNETLGRIALKHGVSERTINRWRDAGGWARRSERVRELPSALRTLHEATALLTEGASIVPGQEPEAPAPSGLSMIERIERLERLVDQEIAAEEASRVRLGRLARTPADAERCARTLATLTQTLHALARLRGCVAPDRETEHDDLPADADECRNELARRVVAFLESREAGGGAERAAGATTVAE